MSTSSLPTLIKQKSRKYKITNSVSDLVRIRSKPQNELEIEEVVLNDMKKNIINDEMNDFQFYEIQQIEPSKTHVETNFRSIHLFSDVTLIRGTKFHHPVKLTELQQKIRNKIAQEPGQLLLLQEIYSKLEENRDYRTSTGQKKPRDHEQGKLTEKQRPENDLQLVSTLESWHKVMKQQRIVNKKKEQIDQDEEDIFVKRARSRQNEQKRRSVVVQTPKRQSVVIQGENQMAFPLLAKRQDSISSHEEMEASPSAGKGNLFKLKIKNSLKKMTLSQKNELTDSERKVNKTVEKYLHQGEGLTQKDFEKLNQKKISNVGETVSDYSIEGLKKSLHTLIKMQITSFSNAHDRSQFYEKQTNSIIQAVNDKIHRQEQEIKKKQNTVALLREENHEIHDKLRQIKTLLGQLNEDYKQVSQSQKEQKLINKVQLALGQNQVKPSSVDNYMVIVNKQNDIQADINVLKESQEGFLKKMSQNNNQLDKIEQEILKYTKNNKTLLKSLQGFLLELLKIGLDCRNTGLSWIIQELWETGERVSDKDFPPFLDQKCREFLMTRTKKVMEVNEIIKKSHQHFLNYKSQMNQHLFPMENSISQISINMEQPTILGSPSVVSFSTYPNSFALINSHQVRAQKTLNSRMKSNEEINLLINGVTKFERKQLDSTMNILNTSKQTLNDLVYQEVLLQRYLSIRHKKRQPLYSSLIPLKQI